jgi:hypothetical protein
MARFCHNLHQARSKFEKMESQTYLQFLEDIKQKGITGQPKSAKFTLAHRHDAVTSN